MKTFYKAFLQAFDDNSNLYTDEDITAPKTIDLYNSQDVNPELSEFFQLPAVLVNMSIDYAPEPSQMNVDVKILYEQLRNTSNFSMNRSAALYFFDLAKITDQIIKGIVSDNTGTLKLTNESMELEPTITDCYNLSYVCNYFGNCETKERETKEGEIEDVTIERGQLFKDLLG